MESNRQSLAKMDTRVQQETCTICIEEIKPECEARIECCSHRFCFDCINGWATKSENSCPLCKKKFNKITYKDVCLNDQFVKIPDKSNNAEEDLECLICDEVIEENQAFTICEICDENAAHEACLRR